MPIRINLLAEAQAEEELRRKDPVKRAVVLGVICAAVMGAVSLIIQSQSMSANRKAEGYSDSIRSITNDYHAVMENTAKLQRLKLNIQGLDLLAAERFLNGSLLNAVQKVYVDNVQLLRLHTEHNYLFTDEQRAKTNAAKIIKFATASEKIVLTIDARDASASPGDQVAKFKESLGKSPYFQKLLGTNNEFRLVNLAPAQVSPDTGQAMVPFTLESRPPEKVRNDIAAPVRYGTPVKPGAKVSAKPVQATEEAP